MVISIDVLHYSFDLWVSKLGIFNGNQGQVYKRSSSFIFCLFLKEVDVDDKWIDSEKHFYISVVIENIIMSYKIIIIFSTCYDLF